MNRQANAVIVMSPLFTIIFVILSICVVSAASLSHLIQEYYSIANGQVFYEQGYKVLPSDGYPPKGHGVPVHKYAAISPECLEALARLEFRIYQRIKEMNATLTIPGVEEYFFSRKEFAKSAQEYLKDYEESSLHLVQDHNGTTDDESVGVKGVAGNPNAVVRMIKRFRGPITQWMVPFKPEKESLWSTRLQQLSLSRFLHREYNTSDGPRLMDLHTSMMAIIILHFQLELKPEDIAAGKFQGTETGVSLRSIDCLEIGLHAIASGYYVVGIEWLEFIVKKSRSNDDSTVDPSLAEELLTLAIKTHDRNWARRSELGEEYELFAEPLSKVSGPERTWNKTAYFESEKPHRLWSVCKGGNDQSQRMRAKLFCWHETEIHPFWKIGPLKVELLSRFPKPEAVQLHDIIRSDDDIQRIKEASLLTDLLHDGLPFNPHYRLGVEDYIAKHRTPVYFSLSRLVHMATGLRFDPPDNKNLIKITAYSPGGWGTSHCDSIACDKSSSCDSQTAWINRMGKPVAPLERKIATLVLYLEDTEAGGETGFVKTGAKAKPQKGSATFWYNMKSSGLIDSDTEHGGCPVVLGEKWILTFWTIYDVQSHLQCDIDRDARIEILVNGRSKYKALST